MTEEKKEKPLPTIAFLLPCYAGLCHIEFTRSLMATMNLLSRYGIESRIVTMSNESLIPRGRNELIHKFLKTDATHAMFIDSDIGWKPEAVLQMIAADKPLIGGIYPKKAIKWDAVVEAVSRGVPANQLEGYCGDMCVNFPPGQREVTVHNNCVEVHDLPTGFMLIRRDLLEQMAYEMPELMYISDSNKTRGEPLFGFFNLEVEPETRRLLSEDYAFVRRWQRLGGKAYAYLTPLTHTGTYTFAGDARSMFEEPETK